MDIMTPALADAFLLLRQDLYGYLDESEYLVDGLERRNAESIESACRLIPELTTVIRGVIAEHEQDDSARCAICSHAWPCPTVRTVHALVKAPESEFRNIVERAQQRDARHL
ncbi:MAG TPA: hypothetical protein VG317_16460 [Pseudonocardiaceae bacterium]|nr:hypothetical protein [Pseudonocardiaceae bacterium]